VSRGRALVIEDDLRIAALLRRGLALKGIDVTVAEDGARGRAAWQCDGFDVVLLDVMLPEVDGIALCAERRAAGDRTPVIILTARDDEETRARGMAAGATDYLVKPFAYGDLIRRVELLLAARRAG
jgi:DNA-binding response OmpR family regulator